MKKELLAALIELLKETNQHAIGNCPKLLSACKHATAIIKTVESQKRI